MSRDLLMAHLVYRKLSLSRGGTGRGHLAYSLGWIKNFSTPQILYEQGIFTGTNDEVTGRLGASYLPRANRL